MTTKWLVDVQGAAFPHGWYNVADGEATAKAPIQVGMLVVEDTPVDGDILVPCPITGLIIPAQVHLADVNFRPLDGATWGGDDPIDYVYSVGELVQRVQTVQGRFYRVWFKNASGGPIILAKGDRLKPSTDTAGMFEILATPDEATVAGLADLKNCLFVYVGNGETVNDTETAFILVERV